MNNPSLRIKDYLLLFLFYFLMVFLLPVPFIAGFLVGRHSSAASSSVPVTSTR